MTSSKSLGIFLGVFVLLMTVSSFAATKRLTVRTSATSPLKESSQDLLERARVQFDKKKFSESIRLYNAIPKSSKVYLQSREELAWAYLQMGEWSSLRGILVHLNSHLIPLEMRLEGRVLASISALHTCEFAQVRDEISKFQKELRPFVAELEQKLKESRSAQGSSRTMLLNQRALAQEAITKMRFVKVELLNQLYRLQREKTKNDILAQSKQLEAQEDHFSGDSLAQLEKSKLVFRAEGDVWPDELFKLRSLSQSECDGIHL